MKDKARVITTADLCDRYSVHRTTIHKWATEGRIPKPTKVGFRNYWRSDVNVLSEPDVAAQKLAAA